MDRVTKTAIVFACLVPVLTVLIGIADRVVFGLYTWEQYALWSFVELFMFALGFIAATGLDIGRRTLRWFE